MISGSNSTISGLTITNGSDADGGAGVFNRSILLLSNCIVSGNSAAGSSGSGGGIFNSGVMAIENCVISEQLRRP